MKNNNKVRPVLKTFHFSFPLLQLKVSATRGNNSASNWQKLQQQLPTGNWQQQQQQQLATATTIRNWQHYKKSKTGQSASATRSATQSQSQHEWRSIRRRREEGEVKERGAEGALCAGVSHNYTHSHTSSYDLCVGQKFSEINA